MMNYSATKMMNAAAKNLAYDIDPEDFSRAITIADKKIVLDGWKRNLDDLGLPECNTPPVHKGIIKLFSMSYEEDIFAIGGFELMEIITRYLNQYNVFIHEILVQKYTKYSEPEDITPAETTPEEPIPAEQTVLYRLKITCEPIYPEKKIYLNPKKVFITINLDSGIKYKPLTFYEINKRPRSNPTNLQRYTPLYDVLFNGIINIVGFFCANEQTLAVRDVFETCKNVYGRLKREFQIDLQKQKTKLINLSLQKEISRLNVFVDYQITILEDVLRR
jgi:hypothetical protein